MSEKPARTARPPLRIALRLAARNARRSLGRSILIVAMMAIPVAGMSATAVVVASSNPTDRELVRLHFADATGIAEIVTSPAQGLTQDPRAPIAGGIGVPDPANFPAPGGERVDPRDVIDGRIIPVSAVYGAVKSGDRIRQAEGVAGDVFVRELAGRYDILEGAAPRGDSEIAVSVALAAQLGIEVGSSVYVPPSQEPLIVTGIGRDSFADNDRPMFFGSETALGVPEELVAAQSGTRFYILDAKLSWNDVLALNEQGIIATSPEVILSGGPYPGALPRDVYGSAYGLNGSYLALGALIGGFLLVQVVLLAGAAFMVGARQQQRALAIVASVGAENRLLRSVVTANGVVLGAIGATVGLGLGIGAGAVVMRLTRNGSALQYPGFHLDPLILTAVVVAAIGAGWIAAAIPARVATRIDIVAALRGARRPAHVRRGARRRALAVMTFGGVSLVMGGVGLVVTRTLDEYPAVFDAVSVGAIGLGAVVLQVGVLLALPSLLRLLARVTTSARTSVRLATRDTSRNAGRTVPVAGAVMSTVFVASFVLTAIGAVQQENEEGWIWTTPPNSISAAARSVDQVTGETRVRDDLAELSAGIATIAGAPATIVNGVAEIQTWGYDPVTGAALIPPPGTTTISVAVDPDQVCPLNMLGAGPDDGETYEAWWGRAAGDPRCVDYREQGNALNSGYDVADPIRVGDVATLESALGASLSAAAVDALEAGRAVALRSEYVREGFATIEWYDGQVVAARGLWDSGDAIVQSKNIPAVVETLDIAIPGALLMSHQAAEQLGLEPTPGMVIAHPTFTVGQAQQDALLELSQQLSGDPWAARAFAQTGPQDIVGPTALILVSATAAIALAASAIALGLARIDGRRDEAILGAVGATRRLRRASGFWQALLLAGLGSLVGTALGVLGAGALALPGGPLPFAPPLVPLAIIGFAVPLVIAGGAWLFAGRGAPLPTDRSAIA
ncbi:FtsX-like permease family protein [Microcella sp.]|uniref:FtsX-like permease family protein n=1 Tax=Microcella sp. TaxID=1913979 RepID=UPI00391D0F69